MDLLNYLNFYFFETSIYPSCLTGCDAPRSLAYHYASFGSVKKLLIGLKNYCRQTKFYSLS